MLKRKIVDYFRHWRKTKDSECLLVKGARQVGKSYAVIAFGRQDYDSLVVIDFVKNPEFKAIFEGSLDPADIYSRMTLLIPDVRLLPGKTLVFLDEIQECPAARSALKYLAQDGRFDVIASGSLLGIRFREQQDAPSLPVGYERQIQLRPLDFEEFLWALGYGDQQIDLLRGYLDRLEPVPRAVGDRMGRILREYLAVGGMPAVVSAFADARDFGAARNAQLMLHDLYLDDIARYASFFERVKARACYTSLPRQLAKENTKFQYSVVEKKGTARKFSGSIDWLEGADMVLPCRSVSTPRFPLAAYESDAFRLYANDTGMLMAMYGFEMMAAVVDDKLEGPMKGGLYENLVASMLAAARVPLRYWRSSDSRHEIEFVVDRGSSVAPIEVKAKRGATASLDAFLTRDDVEIGYKLAAGNVGTVGKKVTLPLYLAPFLFESLATGR